MDDHRAKELIDNAWDDSIIPALSDYIRIPNKSPLFDPDWNEHGHMDAAVNLMERWCRGQSIDGMQIEVLRLEGRTPLLFIEIAGQGDECVLLYGHLDKQPEFSGWEDGLSPWTPVMRDGKLYGRGGADDGYAIFASLTAIRALQDQGIPHARCVIIIEACEESGSFDLPYYVDLLEERIGHPSLVICLDAECGNYDQFWCTTSLRGNLTGTLRASVMEEGVHSGAASGIVPSSFRIIRAVLSRLEDEVTGQITLQALHADIPEARIDQARAAAATLGDGVFEKFAWAGQTRPIDEDPTQLLLNSTWRPSLCVTGAGGLPGLNSAGNTLRPSTELKLSLRLPPTTDPQKAADAIKQTLESDPPHQARVEFNLEQTVSGWDAPPLQDWLTTSMQKASLEFFNAEAMYMGTGGSIPFMAMLGARFPGVQFLVTGVLGPKSNAHGPNEFLHVETGKKLTACVARVLADHFSQSTIASA
ncbi:MAG: M20 family metallopeptidase [Gammaproteobacteria bacterium]|nr:MAG: M20 family metallopeptidase [Gammaproteobacteria bacterium]